MRLTFVHLLPRLRLRPATCSVAAAEASSMAASTCVRAFLLSFLAFLESFLEAFLTALNEGAAAMSLALPETPLRAISASAVVFALAAARPLRLNADRRLHRSFALRFVSSVRAAAIGGCLDCGRELASVLGVGSRCDLGLRTAPEHRSAKVRSRGRGWLIDRRNTRRAASIFFCSAVKGALPWSCAPPVES
eukprot:Amastigsp_a513321_8.p2 type:complete len:192 gc:universal Amastigsp_a513321_8:429-1004(+)